MNSGEEVQLISLEELVGVLGAAEQLETAPSPLASRHNPTSACAPKPPK